MERLIRDLAPEAVVLDLGAGGGSFDYSLTAARVVALDLAFPHLSQSCAGRVAARSDAVPLADACVDVVVANHTLEHFERLRESLREVERVLKPEGRLWVAVPEASTLDDRLYRFLFRGGGHVNRFTLDSLIATIEKATRLRAQRCKMLYSGFVYLAPPERLKWASYPARARVLGYLPPSLLEKALRWGNYGVRWLDRRLGTSLARYGWAVVFRRGSREAPFSQPAEVERMPSTCNVCWRCGGQCPPAIVGGRLRWWLLWRLYQCPACGATNVFVPEPLAGTRRQAAAGSPEEVAREIFGGSDPESVERWVGFWSEGRRRSRHSLESLERLVLLDFQDTRVLDVGCGAGGMGEVLGSRCRLYVGGDYHFHVLRLARQAPRRRFLQCDGLALPFAEGAFDYVFAMDVLEHLVGGRPWQVQFLAELRRVVKPLGMIFLSTPNRWAPYEGHTGLYFVPYLPPFLRDRYLAWRNPGFLKEYSSFAEIRSLSPGGLKACLESAGLAFLHELPCALDRVDYLGHFPLRGLLAYLGLGWWPHAEFWGILVRSEERARLRLKLKKKWYYEQKQPSPTGVHQFGSWIDFERGLYNHQLGRGWYWHERDRRAFRWITKQASCYLQTAREAPYLHVSGYAPRANHLTLEVDGVPVGQHELAEGERFELVYLVPFLRTAHRIFEVVVRCRSIFRPENAADERDLGVMIFSLGMSATLGDS